MADAPAELSTLLSGLLFETITLIEPNELTDEERALIPDWWNEAVRLPGRDGLERALAAWQSTIPDALPSFHAVLRKHGLGVFLGRSDSTNKPLLAYAANPRAEKCSAGTAFRRHENYRIQRWTSPSYRWVRILATRSSTSERQRSVSSSAATAGDGSSPTASYSRADDVWGTIDRWMMSLVQS
jgi:hypothetical protein